jgi:hypothetical protein
VIAACEIAVSLGDSAQVAYEELRGLAVAGLPCSGRLALVVLLREGLAAWFALRLVGSAPAQTAAHLDPAAQVPRPSGEIQTGLVRVLASMVLGNSRKEIFA